MNASLVSFVHYLSFLFYFGRFIFFYDWTEFNNITVPVIRYKICRFLQCCGAGAGGAEIIWGLEPEPKLNF